MDVQYKRNTLKTKVARLNCRRAYMPTGNISSFDDHENSNSWVHISTVLLLGTLRVTELQYDGGSVHDNILLTKDLALGMSWRCRSRCFISSYLISCHRAPQDT